MDDRLFKTAMGKFATGVTVITTEVDGDVHGMTANAFMSVSLHPKLVLVSVMNENKTCERIKTAKAFGVNILTKEQANYSQYFAGQVDEELDVPFGKLENVPIIEDTLVNVACKLYDSHEAGDHTLFIGEVLDVVVKNEEPLLYFEGSYKEFK